MVGYVDPTRARFGEFRSLPDDGPIHMLNLVRLRNRAAYPDGRQAPASTLTGPIRDGGPISRRVGGRIAW